MMRAFACINLVALLAGAAFGQSSEAPKLSVSAPALPTFEIADVHASAHTMNPSMRGGALRGNRYEIRTATMVDLIRTAYGVDADKVLGGPSWLETDRFDVIAKAPPSTSPENVNLMLQALLADRFKLVIHKDSKPLPAYAMTVGKRKLALKEASGSGNSGCQPPSPPPPPPQPGVVPIQTALCRNLTMETFARMLPQMANAYLTNPVKDLTDLKGAWDFDLQWTARGLLQQAGADGVTIFDAVDRLGLKLELQKFPTPVIVVDSVNQKPTDNPPGLTTKLPQPPPPAEFEVADIKPSAPGGQQMGRIQNDRVNVQSWPLKGLITIAWDINSDEMLAGAPKWLDSARFDIVAKASSTTGPANAPQIDFDDLRLMLRALLAERFKLATHMEDRPVNAYTLTAVKPKLQKADPLTRTGCSEGPGADGKDPRIASPVLSRLITCHNMTMAQFADQLPSLAGGYVHTPVLDATGLAGAYDFTLSFSAAGLLQGGVPGAGPAQPAPAGALAASDPNGALSLPDAVNKQLGLKLEMQKRPMPVLVIDHIEEKPTDN